MWEILDHTSAGHIHEPSHSSPSNSIHSPRLFHESLFPTTRATRDQSQTVVETQIFHVPAGEPDTSDGGQAMPPYAGHAINNINSNGVNRDLDNNTTVTPMHNRQTTSTPQQPPSQTIGEDNTTPTNTPGSSATATTAAAQRAQMQYPTLAELANSPWTLSGNLSVLDGGGSNTSRDPFLQFQDIGSPFLGLWEVGSL